MEFQTKTVHAGLVPDPTTGALITPLHQSANFVFDDFGKNKGYEYSRTANPTRAAFEAHLAALEGGCFCVALSTGMAAETTVLSLFRHGDHLICGHDVYGGTYRLLTYLQHQFGLEVSFVPLQDPEMIHRAIRPNTRAVWIETPSNPLFTLIDLRETVHLCREVNLLTIVDNTLLSPYFQQPLAFGVDLVVHSTTKYLCGHNDGLGGAIICNDPALAERLAFAANALGTVSSSFDAWMILRGTKTLALRMREHQKNALALATFLESHPAVRKVHYPGLPSHPQAALGRRQMSGFGGLLSFDLHGGLEAARTLLARTRLFFLAESFGGAESLIAHPQTMSHASMAPEVQAAAGITPGLIRISAGLESTDDLLTDLGQALEAVVPAGCAVTLPTAESTP